jgi:hypothetical protein
MTLEQKNSQFFSSRFITDTEENISGMEQLIRNYNIMAFNFFHSRARQQIKKRKESYFQR